MICNHSIQLTFVNSIVCVCTGFNARDLVGGFIYHHIAYSHFVKGNCFRSSNRNIISITGDIDILTIQELYGITRLDCTCHITIGLKLKSLVLQIRNIGTVVGNIRSVCCYILIGRIQLAAVNGICGAIVDSALS